MSSIINDGILYAYASPYGEPAINIWLTGAQMMAFALLAGTFSIVVAYLAPRLAAGMARNMRRDVFVKVESFSQAEFDKFSSASLITRCTNDVTQVQNLANIFPRMLLYAPILATGGIIMALQRAPSLSWILALMLVVLLGIVAVLVAIIMPKFAKVQEKTDNLNRVSRETLHGLPVIRSFGTQKHEKERFDKSNVDLRNLGLFIARAMALINPAMIFIMAGTQIIIIWAGAHQVGPIDTNYLQIGDMMAFFQYAMQVLFAFMMISMVLVMVPRAQVSAKRISEVLNTRVSIQDPTVPTDFIEEERGKVVFEDVAFSYPNAEASAVENISFTALPGQTTAIIGATGAGKTTIAQLLLRFYDVSEGQITVNGADIREVRQADLRAKIGYIPQKGQLISGTIESNIRYGNPDATDEEVEKIATVAQAIDFIQEKGATARQNGDSNTNEAEDKNGFDAEIAQGGTNVSGGQRQRLSIARALAKNPQILVFDDSFSALDFQTDAKLRKALREHTADATMIVIAQRVGTIISAEQILVLDQGKIVGRGTHAELLQTCPEYHEIASSQGVNENVR